MCTTGSSTPSPRLSGAPHGRRDVSCFNVSLGHELRESYDESDESKGVAGSAEAGAHRTSSVGSCVARLLAGPWVLCDDNYDRLNLCLWQALCGRYVHYDV